MVARDPSRPKAAQLPDLEVLAAIEDQNVHGGVNVLDAFPEWNGKILVAKIRKLQLRQWVITDPHLGYRLTAQGRQVLEGK